MSPRWSFLRATRPDGARSFAPCQPIGIKYPHRAGAIAAKLTIDEDSSADETREAGRGFLWVASAKLVFIGNRVLRHRLRAPAHLHSRGLRPVLGGVRRRLDAEQRADRLDHPNRQQASQRRRSLLGDHLADGADDPARDRRGARAADPRGRAVLRRSLRRAVTYPALSDRGRGSRSRTRSTRRAWAISTGGAGSRTKRSST